MAHIYELPATILNFRLRPDRQAELLFELAAIEEQLLPLEKRAKELRLLLGMVGVDKGISDDDKA